jgi:hypothetical protein
MRRVEQALAAKPAHSGNEDNRELS